MTSIRLMIAVDHLLFREELKALLATAGDIEIVGEVGNGKAALEECRTLQPDIVLMDINMPGLSGIQTSQQILASYPGTRIIMLAMLEDDTSVFAAMRAGARGYLLKGTSPTEMLSVIRAVAEGQAVFGPAIAACLMNYFQELESMIAAAQENNPFPELT